MGDCGQVGGAETEEGVEWRKGEVVGRRIVEGGLRGEGVGFDGCGLFGCTGGFVEKVVDECGFADAGDAEDTYFLVL